MVCLYKTALTCLDYAEGYRIPLIYILLDWIIQLSLHLVEIWRCNNCFLFQRRESTVHGGMFLEVLFRSENVGRQRDFANFWHFLTWIQSFFKPIEFLGLNNVNWFEKRLKSCEKMSKICQITLSADVFTAKQNLRKHSIVQWLDLLLPFVNWGQVMCE